MHRVRSLQELGDFHVDELTFACLILLFWTQNVLILAIKLLYMLVTAGEERAC
ncbi:hypothetical protein BDV59DRAFT_188726, partial [Aspergillus ambiguus]|uniref:uncharacterized protein n=1 Tax=Aspergillus ambiguus TaxID=176160 RepID=UPI003CCE2043